MRKKGSRMLWGRTLSAFALAVLFFVGYAPAVRADVTLEVLNPRGEIPAKSALAPSPRVSDLAGKKIGLVANYKAGAELFITKIEELLKQKYPTATILRFKMQSTQDKSAAEKVASEVATKCDTFVHSTGD